MNCSSTHLTSDPTRVMLLTWQQPDSTATALNKFCSICTPNGVYTEFGIDPQLTRFLESKDFDDPHLELEGVSIDELGLDAILYFPAIRSYQPPQP